MSFFIWDNCRTVGFRRTYIIESRLQSFQVDNFLTAIFGDGKIVATATAIEFSEGTDLHFYLGDLVQPNMVHRCISESFIKENLPCIKACLSRWNASKLHPDQDRYLILVRTALPKDETKQQAWDW